MNESCFKGCFCSKAGIVKKAVIPDWIRDLRRLSLPLQLRNNVRGRWQIKSAMTSLCNNGGFTLIELLVVVLIIGILAAVYLPQYKKAVIKSRVSTIFPVLASLVTAQDTYYLANGVYPDNATLLDIEPPAQCTELPARLAANADAGKWWKCGNDFLVDTSGPIGPIASYCPNFNTSYDNCLPHREFAIVFVNSHPTGKKFVALPNARLCLVTADTVGDRHAICKMYGPEISCLAGTCYRIN